jgi:hypothetical protein
MTTPLDGPLPPVAAKLIAKFGKRATLRTVTSVYNPALGRTVDTEVDVPMRGILEDYSGMQMGGNAETGEGILRGDKKFTIAAHGLEEPSPEARVLIDGTGWGIIKVDSVYSGDLAALFVLQIRR